MNRGTLTRLAEAQGSVYQRIVDATPKLKRGRVWCRSCTNTVAVDPIEALKRGWPCCCGATMTLDSPDERAGRGAQA